MEYSNDKKLGSVAHTYLAGLFVGCQEIWAHFGHEDTCMARWLAHVKEVRPWREVVERRLQEHTQQMHEVCLTPWIQRIPLIAGHRCFCDHTFPEYLQRMGFVCFMGLEWLHFAPLRLEGAPDCRMLIHPNGAPVLTI